MEDFVRGVDGSLAEHVARQAPQIAGKFAKLDYILAVLLVIPEQTKNGVFVDDLSIFQVHGRRERSGTKKQRLLFPAQSNPTLSLAEWRSQRNRTVCALPPLSGQTSIRVSVSGDTSGWRTTTTSEGDTPIAVIESCDTLTEAPVRAKEVVGASGRSFISGKRSGRPTALRFSRKARTGDRSTNAERDAGFVGCNRELGVTLLANKIQKLGRNAFEHVKSQKRWKDVWGRNCARFPLWGVEASVQNSVGGACVFTKTRKVLLCVFAAVPWGRSKNSLVPWLSLEVNFTSTDDLNRENNTFIATEHAREVFAPTNARLPPLLLLWEFFPSGDACTNELRRRLALDDFSFDDETLISILRSAHVQSGDGCNNRRDRDRECEANSRQPVRSSQRPDSETESGPKWPGEE